MKRANDEEDYGRWEADSKSGGKFWTCSRVGNTVNTTWGKLGSAGQSSSKEFDSVDKAEKFATTTIAKKEKEGYKRVGAEKKANNKNGGDFAQVPVTKAADKALWDEWVSKIFRTDHRDMFPAQPLTDEIIKDCQERLQLRLPAPYIHFCRSLNGGLFAQSIVTWVTGDVELPGVSGIGAPGDSSNSVVDQYSLTKDEWCAGLVGALSSVTDFVFCIFFFCF